MSKIKKYWKGLSRGWRWVILVIAVLIILFFGFRLIGGGNGVGETAVATHNTIVQKVSVSGKVESAQKVELAFEVGGTVRTITRNEGELVKAGDLIASLNTSELAVRLARGQAALEKARLALATLVEPPKVTDRLAAENEVAKSKEALAQAKDDIAAALAETLVDLPTVLNKMDSLVTAGSGYISDSNVRLAGDNARAYKVTAEASYWTAQRSYNQNRKNPTIETIYETTKLTAAALKDLYTLVAYLEDQGSNSTDSDLIADKAALSTYTNTINTHLAALLAAESGLDKANRDVIEAEEKLRDLLDGPTANDRVTQELNVRQAELDVQDTRVQIAKQQIRAPFDGVVARNDLELGQTVAAGDALVSMISENAYEIISKVPEAEISKIAVGDPARITLDAYPPEELQLEAQVAAVNSAEVVIDGVATYKVTLRLSSQQKNLSNEAGKIKSGMTANVEIIGASKDDALVIPERALLIKNGGYAVRLVQDNKLVERSVSVGLRGSDGQVEIISGLIEGDVVAVGA